jgi:aspartyl-tRNA(Asn)/glutamyl-tRNA(Gln) amidotransferase subunit C
MSRSGPSQPTIDRKTVEHVAKLASLSLSADECDRFTTELASILNHVDELSKIDVLPVAPTAQVVGQASPLRPDVVRPSLSNDQALSGAPRKDHGGFAVPAFVEGS